MMLRHEAIAKLNEEVKKINLAINADRLPEDKKDVFSEFQRMHGQPMILVSCIDTHRLAACVDFTEVRETDDLASLVFERSQLALEHLIDQAEKWLECLNKSQKTNAEPNPKENTDG